MKENERPNIQYIYIYIHTYICIYINIDRTFFLYLFIVSIWPLVFLHRMFCLAPAIVLLTIFLKIWTWQENINFEWKSLQKRGIHSKIPSKMRDPMKNTAKKPGSDQKYRRLYCFPTYHMSICNCDKWFIFDKKSHEVKHGLLKLTVLFWFKFCLSFRDSDLMQNHAESSRNFIKKYFFKPIFYITNVSRESSFFYIHTAFFDCFNVFFRFLAEIHLRTPLKSLRKASSRPKTCKFRTTCTLP